MNSNIAVGFNPAPLAKGILAVRSLDLRAAKVSAFRGALRRFDFECFVVSFLARLVIGSPVDWRFVRGVIMGVTRPLQFRSFAGSV
jgi:hypothetical protein